MQSIRPTLDGRAAELEAFQRALTEFAACSSTYKETEKHKGLAAALVALAAAGCAPAEWGAALSVYWGLLFMENARPLQRQVHPSTAPCITRLSLHPRGKGRSTHPLPSPALRCRTRIC